MKLNIKAFALTCGILWGLLVLLATWFLLIMNSPGTSMGKLGVVYFGYTYSWLGGIIGLIWGFVDGLISGAIFAWLYNKLTGSRSN